MEKRYFEQQIFITFNWDANYEKLVDATTFLPFSLEEGIFTVGEALLTDMRMPPGHTQHLLFR